MQTKSTTPRPPIRQQFDSFWLFFVFPASSLLIFLRRNLGYRFVSLRWFLFLALAFWLGAAFAHEPEQRLAMRVYALYSLLVAALQRWRRWREAKRGIITHSRYIGDSRYEASWLPAALHRERRVPRFVDPAVCILAGFIIGKWLYPFLGLWIAFCGFCVRVVEDTARRNAFYRRLDTFDSLVEAEAQMDSIKTYSPQQKLKVASAADLRTLPTGVGPDIHDKIARHEARKSIGKP